MPHIRKTLERYYALLHDRYGPTGWWPGNSPFEIAIGAILTQNTAWTNVEKAIVNLKRERLLSPKRLSTCPLPALEAALVPSGYFRVKAKRVRSFSVFLIERYQGSIKRMAKQPLDSLRDELLAIHGIGPETADDILLYGCAKPVFVVDAYTRRILSRHGLVDSAISYEALRATFESRLEPDVQMFKEYHGLIVWTGKDHCRPKPRCESCPLAPTLKMGQPFVE